MPRYTFATDLGGAPHGEPCAQLGHTENFAAINVAEVALYRAAIIALYGPPPEAVRLRSFASRHDFGTYRTLVADVLEEASENLATTAYLDDIENGVERWIDAGFSPPITYGPHGAATLGGRTIPEIIRGAMMTTRPMPLGEFFPPEFRQLHRNLLAGYPEIAGELVLPA